MRAVRLALLLVLCSLVPAADAVAAERRVPQGFYGAVWDGQAEAISVNQQELHWDRMAESGVESVRTTFSWEKAQPAPGDPVGFAYTDLIVEWAAERQIDLLPVIDHPPSWAQVDPDASASPPARIEEFAAFARQLVSRYGPGGSFWAERPELPQRPLRTWQVLNEPHFRSWHRGVAAPDRRWARPYVKLLRRAQRAIRDADPEARIALAGLASASWIHLRELYDAGARRYFDIVTQHPYVSSARRVREAVRLMRGVMARSGDRRKPLWLTELGWPASRGKVPNRFGRIETTAGGAAQRLRRSLRLLVRARRRPSLRANRFFYYTWASSYGGTYAFDYAGLLLLTNAGESSAQPAFDAYVAAARRDEGCLKTAAGVCAP
jgi:polysaccharide biosynthesis protein PslG